MITLLYVHFSKQNESIMFYYHPFHFIQFKVQRGLRRAIRLYEDDLGGSFGLISHLA